MTTRKQAASKAASPASEPDEPEKVEPEPEKEPELDYDGKLGAARNALADELVRATRPDEGRGMDVIYAGQLATILKTMKEL